MYIILGTHISCESNTDKRTEQSWFENVVARCLNGFFHLHEGLADEVLDLLGVCFQFPVC